MPSFWMLKTENGRKYRTLLVCTVLLLLVFFSVKDGITRFRYPTPYRSFVTACAETYQVPISVIYAVMRTESSFDAQACSSAGACGLMQLMPQTFAWIVSELQLEKADIFSPQSSILCGTYYLAELYRRFGDWETVYAAYNAGPTRVAEWLRAQKGTLKSIPFPETRSYVSRVRASRAMYEKILKGMKS